MEIVLANPRGFCAGVDRAIDIATAVRTTTGRSPSTVVLNRALSAAPAWPERLAQLGDANRLLLADARAANDELSASAHRTREAEAMFARAIPGVTRGLVPPIAAPGGPAAVVDQAAGHIARAFPGLVNPTAPKNGSGEGQSENRPAASN